MTIIITALTTLVVTILAGVLLDYFKNVKPKIIYKVKDSVPINLDERKVGAYSITIVNTSKKTIKDVSVHIKAEPATISNGGISCPQGFDYKLSTGEKEIEIKMPFLKGSDEFSITVIAEGYSYVPTTPSVAIRSPQQFKLLNIQEITKKKTTFPWFSGLVASITATTVVFSFISDDIIDFIPKDQKDVLTFAASVSELPDLAKEYALSDDLRYFNQGDLAFILAKTSKNPDEILKYKKFLDVTLESAPKMQKTSQCNTLYNLGKIALLIGDSVNAKQYFSKAIALNEKHIRALLKFDQEISEFIAKENILVF